MLEFEDAQQRILQVAAPLGSEQVELHGALGRYLSEPIRADRALPPFDYSAMDGYAAKVSDFDGDGPWRLPIFGESRAGQVPPALKRASVCRIFTGARIPAGADTVVIQEDVDRDGDSATLSERPQRGANIRREGEDVACGAQVLDRGVRLDPFKLGLLAALDRAQVRVAKKPRVSILCCGDELRPVGAQAIAATIPESNSVVIAGLADSAGALAEVAPPVADDLNATQAAITRALRNTDVLITVGGASVGDHDLVQAALEGVGVEIDFWKVRIKPGKPLLFGRSERTLVLGLPGNPVSAQVTFSLFGLPLLRKLQGAERILPVKRTARLKAAFEQVPGRLGFYRAKVEGDQASILSGQASGAANSMAVADALVMVPAQIRRLEQNSPVEVLLLTEL